jgi:ribosomal protein L29
MKITEFRKLSTKELTNQSVKMREEIAELRRHLYSGETTNVRALRNKRKDYARLQTVLSEQLIKEVK